MLIVAVEPGWRRVRRAGQRHAHNVQTSDDVPERCPRWVIRDGVSQRLGAPHTGEKLVAAVVVHGDRTVMVLRGLSERVDRSRREKRQIRREDSEPGRARVGQRGGERGDRPPARRLLPGQPDPRRQVLLRADEEPGRRTGHRIEDSVEHRAAADLQRGLVHAAEPAGAPTGEHDRVVRGKVHTVDASVFSSWWLYYNSSYTLCMATNTFSVRADAEVQRALAELGVTPDGRNRSQIVRAAILTAAKEARRAALRAETAALAKNPNDLVEIRAVQADLDPLRAW